MKLLGSALPQILLILRKGIPPPSLPGISPPWGRGIFSISLLLMMREEGMCKNS